MNKVIISRDCSDHVYCEAEKKFKPLYDHRVYVVGPLWDQHGNYMNATYTSTPLREKASQFSREVAEALIMRGKWMMLAPLIEEPVSSKGCES